MGLSLKHIVNKTIQNLKGILMVALVEVNRETATGKIAAPKAYTTLLYITSRRLLTDPPFL